ncbi:CASPA protein, partial [Serilophus lunatus]|nr:CASPA protein [Serilophus lunatus]
SSNMEVVDGLEQLLQISENLGAEEVAALKFLCTDLVSLRKLEGVKSAADIFNLLMNEEHLNEEDTFLVAELLHRIKCHSLLKTLNYTKEKVQECLHEKGRVSAYRQMLYELSENISDEIVEKMKFLLQKRLPKRWAVHSALDLLISLEKQDLLTENNVDILEEVFKTVSPNLLKIINCYKKAKGGLRQFLKSFLNTWGDVVFIVSVMTFIMQGHERYIWRLLSHHQFKLQSLAAESCLLHIDENPDGNPFFCTFSFSFLQKMASYKMDGPKRGFCLVINNVKFESSFERMGSDKDAEDLKRVFTWLGLDVTTCTNQTSVQIEELMETWQHLQDHKDQNCFICCILSHGESGGIYGTDDELVSIRAIMSHFTGKQCPQLAGKPKLFFIQACQGGKVQCPVYIDGPESSSMQKDVSLSESIPEDADFLLGMSTVDGYASIRHPLQGSWYIQSLCEKLQLLVPRGEDILSILTEVNKDVARRVANKGTVKQMPQPAYTLRKKFIFPIPKDPSPS